MWASRKVMQVRVHKRGRGGGVALIGIHPPSYDNDQSLQFILATVSGLPEDQKKMVQPNELQEVISQ